MTIWLAVGDEAGNWDHIGNAAPNDKRHLGIALVLAPIPTWKTALQERLAGTTIEQHMQHCPVTGVNQTHHVKETLEYLKDHHLQGQWQLDEPGPDPVKSSLCQSFRWLASTPAPDQPRRPRPARSDPSPPAPRRRPRPGTGPALRPAGGPDLSLPAPRR